VRFLNFSLERSLLSLGVSTCCQKYVNYRDSQRRPYPETLEILCLTHLTVLCP